MAESQQPNSILLWTEPWAVDASVKAEIILARMHQALAALPQQDARAIATAEAIRGFVERGREATTRSNERRRRSFTDAWRGTSVGEAYQSLHAAEILLLDLLGDEDVEAMVPTITARAREVFDRDDPRLVTIGAVRAASPGVRRACLRNALGLVYDSADQAYVRVRDFRNVLYISAGLISFLMTALAVVVWFAPSVMPFCFDPGATTPAGAGSGRLECPSGRGESSGYDVLTIAGLGLIGGALAAAFSIRHLRGTNVPYDIPIALAMLKVPSGSLTAVVGMLLLGGGFVPGLSELDSQRQILAYALLFGYAQQIATRLVDERAQRILDSVPAKPDASPSAPTHQPSRRTAAPDAASSLPSIPKAAVP